MKAGEQEIDKQLVRAVFERWSVRVADFEMLIVTTQLKPSPILSFPLSIIMPGYRIEYASSGRAKCKGICPLLLHIYSIRILTKFPPSFCRSQTMQW